MITNVIMMLGTVAIGVVIGMFVMWRALNNPSPPPW